MRKVSSLRRIAVLPALLLAALSAPAMSVAQEGIPVVKATRPVVSIREGDTLRRDVWTLAPELNPDVYTVDLEDGKPTTVAFITDVDSVSFLVEEGGQYEFVIEHGEDRCLTRIVGMRAVPAAVFDARYQAAHRGKISVEIPEVYELVNVAIAMTSTGLSDSTLVYHHSDYYEAVRAWFDPYREHPALLALDEVLARNRASYARLKMNGYAFEFDEDGRIVQSEVYDRTSFRSERSNSLRPYIPRLQEFADLSNFREFYRRNEPTYADQIAFYEQEADVEAMLAWLDGNFPASSGYDTYKVIFSPLVAYSQSATWLESNGFRELQAHVNYPYPRDVARATRENPLSKEAETVYRGSIVFTELNHGYINPEADRYGDRVTRAISQRDHWVDAGRESNYYPGIATFNEYMNWALVSLRVVDLAPAAEQATLIGMVDGMMVNGRGFPEFAAFDAFLVDLYRNRSPGQTVADLYPRIIEWFESENGSRIEPSPTPRE